MSIFMSHADKLQSNFVNVLTNAYTEKYDPEATRNTKRHYKKALTEAFDGFSHSLLDCLPESVSKKNLTQHHVACAARGIIEYGGNQIQTHPGSTLFVDEIQHAVGKLSSGTHINFSELDAGGYVKSALTKIALYDSEMPPEFFVNASKKFGIDSQEIISSIRLNTANDDFGSAIDKIIEKLETATDSAESSIENSRKGTWYKTALTHAADGKFSLGRTALTGAVTGAVISGVGYLSRERQQPMPQIDAQSLQQQMMMQEAMMGMDPSASR